MHDWGPPFKSSPRAFSTGRLDPAVNVFYCDPQGSRAVLRIRSRDGQGMGEAFAHVGLIQSLKDLKSIETDLPLTCPYTQLESSLVLYLGKPWLKLL